MPTFRGLGGDAEVDGQSPPRALANEASVVERPLNACVYKQTTVDSSVYFLVIFNGSNRVNERNQDDRQGRDMTELCRDSIQDKSNSQLHTPFERDRRGLPVARGIPQLNKPTQANAFSRSMPQGDLTFRPVMSVR